MALLQSNTDSFEHDVVRSELPVFVDFWAEWCAPCRVIGPILEQLSKEYDGKVKFVKVNVDENAALADRYGIMGIPTLIIFKSGKEVDRIVGAAPRDQYTRRIEKVLAGG